MEVLVGRSLWQSSALRMSKLRSELLCLWAELRTLVVRRSCARSPDMQGEQNLKNAAKYW